MLGLLCPRSWAQNAENLKRSVVRITASDGTIGSGFVVEVSPEAVFLVTVSHILEKGDDSPSVEFEIPPRRSYRAVIKDRDTDAGAEGLALLRVAAPFPSGLAALPAAQDVPEITQSIQVVGFPYSMGNRFSVLPGSVTSRAGSKIRITAPVGDGSSGGPVLSNGRVVGIVTRGGGGLGTATLASIVKIYLKGNDIDWEGMTIAGRPNVPSQGRGDLGSSDILVDPRTGLMWTRTDNGYDIKWHGADQYCKGLTLGGYTDWRLPEIKELDGIHDPNNVTGKYTFAGKDYEIHTISGFRLSTAVLWSATAGPISPWDFNFADGRRHRNLLPPPAFKTFPTTAVRPCVCVVPENDVGHSVIW